MSGVGAWQVARGSGVHRSMASRSDQVELETPHMALPTRHMVGPRIPSEVRSQDIAFDTPPSRPHFQDFTFGTSLSRPHF